MLLHCQLLPPATFSSPLSQPPRPTFLPSPHRHTHTRTHTTTTPLLPLPLPQADPANNVLKHAPHCPDVVLADVWDRPYGREKAAFPAPWVRAAKFWPTTSRVDNVYGDRHLVLRLPDPAAP